VARSSNPGRIRGLVRKDATIATEHVISSVESSAPVGKPDQVQLADGALTAIFVVVPEFVETA
jgi:hypothetical protein